MTNQKLPLRCHFQDGALRIEIGSASLRTAAEQHPDFWDGESGTDVPNIKVTDEAKFALEVVRALNDEGEDGSTMVTRLLDEAMKHTVEQGCEGVDHE